MEKKSNPLSGHPRLLFTEKEIERLRQELSSEKQLMDQFTEFEAKAASLMDSSLYSEEYANSIYSQHGRFYEIGAQLTAYAERLGFLYQVTGKEKYALKIKEALLHYASFAAWTGPANRGMDACGICYGALLL